MRAVEGMIGMKKPQLVLLAVAVPAVFVALATLGVSRLVGGLAALPTQLLRNPFALTAQPPVSGTVVLSQVQHLQRLETCRYNGNVVVKGETRGALPIWIAGDRLLFVGYGEVVAGLDLTRLHPADVQVDGTAVTLRLPPAEILTTRLDNQRSEAYQRQTGVFSGPDLGLESRVRAEAETRIQAAALADGVLDTAAAGARATLRRHLNALGFRTVRFL